MTILLIEDDKRLAEFISFSLSNHTVLIVDTLKAAHDALVNLRPSLLLIDLNLPDSSGLDTLKSLKYYKCPRIVITAQKNIGHEVALLGAIDYIEKSSGMEELINRIKFNISKYIPKSRFNSDKFKEIQACLCNHKELSV